MTILKSGRGRCGSDVKLHHSSLYPDVNSQTNAGKNCDRLPQTVISKHGGRLTCYWGLPITSDKLWSYKKWKCQKFTIIQTDWLEETDKVSNSSPSRSLSFCCQRAPFLCPWRPLNSISLCSLIAKELSLRQLSLKTHIHRSPGLASQRTSVLWPC